MRSVKSSTEFLQALFLGRESLLVKSIAARHNPAVIKLSLSIALIVLANARTLAQSQQPADSIEFQRINQAWQSLILSIDRQTEIVKKLSASQEAARRQFQPDEERAKLIEQVIKEHVFQLELFQQMLAEERPYQPLPWQSRAVENVRAATEPAQLKKKKYPRRKHRRR